MIIGIIGKKESGKSTIAEYLRDKYAFTSYAIAEPLKKIGSIFGFTDHQMYIDKLEINTLLGICFREFAQLFGTDICRKILPRIIPNMKGIIWVKLLELFIEQHISVPIVIEDVRFIDEAQAINQYSDAYIIEVKRCVVSDNYSFHNSELENEQITSDFQIMNNSSMNDLYTNIDAIVNLIKK